MKIFAFLCYSRYAERHEQKRIAVLREKNIKLFLASIASLIGVGLLLAFGAKKIGGLFSAMDWAAWTMVAVMFFVVIGLSLRADEPLKRLPWRQLQENEDLREYLAIVLIAMLLALVCILLWPLIGQYIAPHFGASTR